MSDISIQDLNSSNSPFFTRYLEDQLQELTETETQAAKGGNTAVSAPVPELPPLTFKGGIVSHGDELESPQDAF